MQPERLCQPYSFDSLVIAEREAVLINYLKMCNLESLKIDLKGLLEDQKEFHFSLDHDYFEAIEAPEVSKGHIEVCLLVRRTAGHYYELDFQIEGFVIVSCDRCLDDMEQPVRTEGHLVAKLGTEYSEDDDLITIDENEGILDVAWFIYEFIALDIPIKHVHAPGKCNHAMIQMLEEHSAARSSDGEEEKTIDPRWSGLERLKNNIKD